VWRDLIQNFRVKRRKVDIPDQSLSRVLDTAAHKDKLEDQLTRKTSDFAHKLQL
jgi:hypothetical protein